ncbi:haloacid dehalogenase-like hydrolase [Macroventuria anomochaeta]|uniref:Haloacid dehalogenase-like hydrolase n=1 Tax=Macroventuria anomochaeta TaxID=301207 RepID=A0ACB6RZM7_9PLEO|nr:haloacid dehalogenase-like hydrolase [Macroventuria anomochaeta]KAF2627331.1 haloacid dehalogenase-like hydrolase [Macroventuria anomochaeta]
MASQTSPKHIVFDIVGTLVSHEHFYDVISTRLGTALEPHNISGRLLGYAWLETAEREYTYLSLSGRYVPFAKIFQAIFFRVLHFAGVHEPRSVANEEDVEYFIQEYKNCTVRPGARECIDRLQKSGWTVWAFTSGDRERVKGYFNKGDISIDNEHIITCDDVGIGKPEIKAYERVKERIGAGKDESLWFAAAHGWDVSAASRAGFKTAYCTVLEKEPLEDVFGKTDVTADTLPALANKVIEAA